MGESGTKMQSETGSTINVAVSRSEALPHLERDTLSPFYAQIAAAVRASNDSSYVEARRHNLHPTTVQAIRRGDTWRDFSSPEVQLQLMQQRKQA